MRASRSGRACFWCAADASTNNAVRERPKQERASAVHQGGEIKRKGRKNDGQEGRKDAGRGARGQRRGVSLVFVLSFV